MQNLSTPLRRLLAVILTTAFGLCGALLLTGSPAAAAVVTADQLVLTWVDGGKGLQVDGFEYRPNEVVDVRLGSSSIQQTRSDRTGKVQVTVPQSLVAEGQSGASIVVAGRSVSGSSRVLVSAVPPRAAVHGPVDVLPWSIGAIVVGLLLLGAGHRARSRRAPLAATSAPHGYVRRHAA